MVADVRRRVPFAARDALWAGAAALLGLATVLPPLLLAGAIIVAVGVAQPIVFYFLMLVGGPLKTLIETEAHFSLDVGQIAFALTVAGYLAHQVAARKRLFPFSLWNGVTLALIVMILGAAGSLFVAESPAQTVSELVKWAEVLVISVVTAALAVQYGRWSVLAGILLAGCVQALIGLYEFAGGSGAPNLRILDNRFFRAFGTYGQPNPFGAMMEITLVLTLGLLFGAGAALYQTVRAHTGWGGQATTPTPDDARAIVRVDLRIRPNLQVGQAAILAIILLGICGLLGAGLIASWSRGAWLGTAAGVAVLIIFAPRRRWLGLSLVMGAAVIIFGGAALGLLPNSLTARLSDFTQDLTGIDDVRGETITSESYAVLERLAHWQAAVAMANDHPWLGLGFGNYEVAYPRYALMNWKYPLGHAHNYYLNALAETGILGFVTYVGGWLAIAFVTVRRLHGTTGVTRGLLIGMLGVWAAIAVHSIFDKLYVNNLFLQVGAMFGLMLTRRGTHDPI